MTLQSSQRLPELLFYTKKSYRILQLQFQLHVHITLQSREFSIQNPILHAEDKELFKYYTTRNSTHRRQGDLLEMHPCVSQDLPGIQPQVLTKATPVTPIAPETFRTFQSFMTFQPFQAILQILHFSSISRESTPFQHSPIRMHILHILQFYSSIGFHRKLHRVPVGQLQTLQTLHSSKKGRCCDIGQIDRFSIIELFPLSSCQVIILIARMTFNCFSSCLMS